MALDVSWNLNRTCPSLDIFEPRKEGSSGYRSKEEGAHLAEMAPAKVRRTLHLLPANMLPLILFHAGLATTSARITSGSVALHHYTWRHPGGVRSVRTKTSIAVVRGALARSVGSDTSPAYDKRGPHSSGCTSPEIHNVVFVARHLPFQTLYRATFFTRLRFSR